MVNKSQIEQLSKVDKSSPLKSVSGLSLPQQSSFLIGGSKKQKHIGDQQHRPQNMNGSPNQFTPTKKELQKVNVESGVKGMESFAQSSKKKIAKLRQGKCESPHKFGKKRDEIPKSDDGVQESQFMRELTESYIISDQAEGEGIIEHEGKLVYSGEIRNGRPNGHGTVYNGFNCYNLLNWAKPFEKIEGYFVDGLLNGKCRFFDGTNWEEIQVLNGIIV